MRLQYLDGYGHSDYDPKIPLISTILFCINDTLDNKNIRCGNKFVVMLKFD